MAKRRIVEAISCEFELPEHIIQRIQSFLTGKAAARTAVLSKSWRKAWLTRPNIDFDCEDCPNNDGLLELANKTIQRYEESNLKIDCFRLHLLSLKYDDFDLAKTLIVKAPKLCAHLSFEIKQGWGEFVIPREVFESENLLGLSVRGCGIDLGMDHNVRCSKLQSLSLNFVKMHNLTWYDSFPINLLKLSNLKRLVLSSIKLDTLFFRDMSSNFPSLKDLTLKILYVGGCAFDVGRCSRLESLSLNSVEMQSRGMISKIISSCPLIENLSLSKISGQINLLKLRNLKRLVLSGVELDTLFFRDMSSKFPSLKDLTLEDLSVGGCTFDVGMDQNVRCSRLQSLSLNSVEIESRDIISKIISSCPLIENMSLSKIRDERYNRSVMSGPISLPKLHNIKCLVLCCMQFDTLFLYDLSSKLPFLKDLTLNGFWRSDKKEIQISSRSLEHLNLAPHHCVIFEFDVPSIRKFMFEGSFIPSVSFKPTSREWESHISIKYSDTGSDPLDTWFVGLNELLTALIPSKIYLSIDGRSARIFCFNVIDIQGLPQAEVENLTVDIRYLPIYHCYTLFDGIFRACRPKFITQYLHPLQDKTNSDFLCKTLAQGVNGEFSHPWDFMYALNGLKEVNVQVFDEFVAAWKDLPCKSLSEALELPEEKKKIRFRLVWKP